MSITKYAKLEVGEILDVKGSKSEVKTASLNKLADFHDYRTEDGYLYARIRAISSRVNKNNDGWPSVELAGDQDIFDRHLASEGGFTVEASEGSKTGFATFVGKPIFVDHNNSDPERARGVIVDAKFHVEDGKTAGKLDPYYASAPDNHMPPCHVELLLEVDAKTFPKLAEAIIKGASDADKGIDGFSMGCDVEKTICNICKNSATAPDEYCDHVKMKGAEFDELDDKTGKKTGKTKKAFEDCYGVRFFEISAVFDPADETALTKEVISEGEKTSARVAHRLSETDEPQSMMVTAPEDVDTLRQESICDVCGSSMESERCDICGWVKPPEGLDNPDLDRAQGEDLPEGELGPAGEEPVADPLADPAQQAQEPQGQTPMGARNRLPTARVTSDMAWETSVHPRVAGRINPIESPVLAGQPVATSEPQETTVSDETSPTTKRTAADLIEAAGNSGANMSDTKKVAAEPADSSGKADKRVDVEGVGGVDQASNDQASKADAQVDVTGKGGTGVQDVSADQENVNVDQGDEHSKSTDDSGKTDTFKLQPGHLDAGKVHDNGAFPKGGANQGVKPNGGADVQPSKRVDVEDNNFDGNGGTPTDQWTGTDGNGVTKQQNPVTRETINSHVVSVFKLADTEVELGLTEKENKYARIAELEQQSPELVQSQLSTLARVRTAGLKKAPARTSAHKLPNMTGPTVPEVKEASTESDERLDSAIFG